MFPHSTTWNSDLYKQLHGLALQRLGSSRVNPTLGATALVHEVFLRLEARETPIADQRGFLAMASYAIRSVIVDHVRRKKAQKRGGLMHGCPIDNAVCVYQERAGDLLGLDEALTRLQKVDDRLAEIVNLRFFGGLSEEQVAQVLGVSSRTIRRDWQLARAWLRNALRDGVGKHE